MSLFQTKKTKGYDNSISLVYSAIWQTCFDQSIAMNCSERPLLSLLAKVVIFVAWRKNNNVCEQAIPYFIFKQWL
jgi:hypothetical protein